MRVGVPDMMPWQSVKISPTCSPTSLRSLRSVPFRAASPGAAELLALKLSLPRGPPADRAGKTSKTSTPEISDPLFSKEHLTSGFVHRRRLPTCRRPDTIMAGLDAAIQVSDIASVRAGDVWIAG